jgi:A-macroglobulin TED domain/Alpha-2-macroglobulin family/Carboxypeptidase regulatory-like domain/MG2 domain/A-macroglobulin receptor binding domain/Alpha-2-macroglobulin bait region domain
MHTRCSNVLLQLFLPPLVALLLIVFTDAYAPFTEAGASSAAATFTHGALSVTLPYQGARPGSGKLIAEIVDPEEQVLGRAERAVAIVKADGTWQQTIEPAQPIAFEDVVWQRVRYRFEYDDKNVAAITGVESVSRILRRPVVHILGQTEYLAGSDAAIRVLVSDAGNEDAALTGTVRGELLIPQRRPHLLFSGRLNQHGTVAAQFRFPAGLAGKYDVRFTADTPIGSTEFTQPILIKDSALILLTTEKPIYQPGQTIHVRALGLDRASHRADAARNLTFEVEDSRGNKVFKKSTATDRFGVASAEFSLADEVNLGTYHLRAIMGDGSAASNTAEIALNVERYVLPKFKVAVEFTEKDHKPRRDYRPGDHVTGTVRANYFFGKPVDHAETTIKITSMDVAVFEAASAKGKTDKDGVYHFDLQLPPYFAGRSVSKGAARAVVEATIKDSAEHAETRGEPITVSQSALLITAVPEGGTLIPHLENQVFLLSSYPDGTPAAASLTVHIPGAHDQHVTADSSGIATINFAPGSESPTLRVDADDHRGARTTVSLPLEMRGGADQILLRVNHAVVKTGERIALSVVATRTRGSAYIDIVRNGQTILTRDVDLQNGQAELTLAATAEMAGTLDINAYLIGRDAQPVADHRLIFVQPADDLKIETTTDAGSYKPGSDARICFRVTNARGEGVSAALGLQIVDEAVFALAEKQPGFAKTFFYLEQEVMKPRYEINSLSLSSALEPAEERGGGRQDGDQADKDRQDRAARALFSATEMATPASLDTEFGRSLPQDKYFNYQQRYRAVFLDQVRKLAARLSKELRSQGAGQDIPSMVNGGRLRDANVDSWNTPLHIERTGWNQNDGRGRPQVYLVRSAGPDGAFNNDDDLVAYIEARSGRLAHEGGNHGTVEIHIEHNRGPWNQRAQVSGTVVDPSGAIVAGATITLHQTSTANTRTAHADAEGRFDFAALAPGKYRVEIASPGFLNLSSELTLEERDRALLSATLYVGSVSQTVMVEAQPSPPLMQAVGGAVGGVMGGVLGGVGMMDAVRVAGGPMARADFAAQPMQGRSFAAALKTSSQASALHVRSYFPEALYINPEIITDAQGNANISIPVADSITTWRMAMLASTASGALGTATSSLKVFQDFFVDLDLPVTLTQGDQVSLPIAVYNYSGKPGQVSLKLQPDDWFSLDHDTAEKSVSAESGRVGGSQFSITATRIGKFKLTLSAHMEGAPSRDDIVVREIEVIPNGREQDLVFNGRLENSAAHDLHFPNTAIADATSILVRLYPGPLSQLIEGMDSILSMPGGCFEQTSSSTYPNVLALDYMKRTKKLTPETHAKAEGYIANGYQRLLTFDVPGGGFSWFGQAPANKILTAYGLMEFNDMAKVSDVDPRLIERTREWLVSQQQPDGSWKPDVSFINEGATDRYNSNVLRITAYIAWSLVNTGMQGPAIDKAKDFIEAHQSPAPDAYTLAVIANFATEYGRDRAFTRRSMQALLDARTEKEDQAFWSAEETGVYSTGASAAIETTGLATQALLKWGQASETVRKALNFIAQKKGASGAWGTTQATIMALRALLLATQLSASDVHGSLQVSLDGKEVRTLEITSNNNDLLHQFVFKNIDAHRPASIRLHFAGTGSLAYQVVGRSFIPWDEKPAGEPLSIDVTYDRTRLPQNDIATETVTIRNHLAKTANMVMVDLGIPPGFDLLSEDLQALQEKGAGANAGRLEKFSLTATQAILYFNGLAPHQEVTLKIRLRAKYPIRAHTFQSRLYEYYDPDVQSLARPVRVEVDGR